MNDKERTWVTTALEAVENDEFERGLAVQVGLALYESDTISFEPLAEHDDQIAEIIHEVHARAGVDPERAYQRLAEWVETIGPDTDILDDDVLSALRKAVLMEASCDTDYVTFRELMRFDGEKTYEVRAGRNVHGGVDEWKAEVDVEDVHDNLRTADKRGYDWVDSIDVEALIETINQVVALKGSLYTHEFTNPE